MWTEECAGRKTTEHYTINKTQLHCVHIGSLGYPLLSTLHSAYDDNPSICFLEAKTYKCKRIAFCILH